MKVKRKITPEKLELNDGVVLEVVQFPYDEVKYSGIDGSLSRVEIQKAMFLHSLVGWTGIEDEEGVPFEVSEENKLHLFRYEHGIRSAVLDKVESDMVGKLSLLKNS